MLGQSFSIVLSITARMNAGEFRRVLRDEGRLLIGIPAPDDLIELRGAGRDRVARTVETFADKFKLADRRRKSTAADLDAPAVRDVFDFDLPPHAIEGGGSDARGDAQPGPAAVPALGRPPLLINPP